MKQIKLNQLKHYLDNEILIKNTDNNRIYKTVAANHTNSIRNGIPITDVIEYDYYIPAFLPLSALTEQLPDGSVPIVELAKIAFPNHETIRLNEEKTMALIDTHGQYDFNFRNGSFDCVYLRYSPRVLFCRVDNQLQLFEYLYQHHFWLGDQSLFETGEIIDKRTLK